MIFGRQLQLEIFGESHAPQVGMRLKGLPEGLKVDWRAVQRFVDRRRSRGALATARREADRIEVVREGAGEIVAVVRNGNTRSGDYERTVPRPGHADYPAFVKFGRIPPGGGANSGRMTVAMCIAGGIALGGLKSRGVSVSSRVVSVGGESAAAARKVILAARQAGDSVGGIVECTVKGLPTGLGGPMFEGLETAIAAAVFAIPGVKGIEFGNGFAAAALRGSENNDAFALRGGRVVTRTNRHGGILGGMASGMPLVFRVAFKPTPSIYLPQASVDLKERRRVVLQVRGRHDPCIVLRGRPVVEAMAAFALYDAMLAETGATQTRVVTDLGRYLRSGDYKVVIDANVARLYPALARGAVLVVPSGERHKTAATVSRLYAAFARAGITRRDTLVAIGGGVTNDLTGFAAATWMRGLDWISVPTTLLAMVDASFGGKTGYDLAAGKNLVGAFHAPREVVICHRLLRTLPPREIAAGKAEMIKHAVIGALDARSVPPHGRLPDLKTILANREVKRRIVALDPEEVNGERMKLNLGHTVAHAVERRSGYRVSHGEAVAIGTVEEARLAERLGLAESGFADSLAALFAAADLPVKLPRGMTFAKLRPLMRRDKKNERGRIVFALPCGWGDVRVVKT